MGIFFDKPLLLAHIHFLDYCIQKYLCKQNFVLNLHAL